jgi:hypothetical protein
MRAEGLKPGLTFDKERYELVECELETKADSTVLGSWQADTNFTSEEIEDVVHSNENKTKKGRTLH